MLAETVLIFIAVVYLMVGVLIWLWNARYAKTPEAKREWRRWFMVVVTALLWPDYVMWSWRNS